MDVSVVIVSSVDDNVNGEMCAVSAGWTHPPVARGTIPSSQQWIKWSWLEGLGDRSVQRLSEAAILYLKVDFTWLHSARVAAPRLYHVNFHLIIAQEVSPRDDDSITHCFRAKHFLSDDTRYSGG